MRTARKLFAALLVLSLFAVSAPVALAYAYTGYTPLDASSPIAFDGATVTWNGKTFTLDENTIYLDYRLDSAQIADHPYAFNNIQDAAAALRDGTAEKPMLLLTAPGCTGWMTRTTRKFASIPTAARPTGWSSIAIICIFTA
jgi:hypothetical protein